MYQNPGLKNTKERLHSTRKSSPSNDKAKSFTTGEELSNKSKL